MTKSLRKVTTQENPIQSNPKNLKSKNEMITRTLTLKVPRLTQNTNLILNPTNPNQTNTAKRMKLVVRIKSKSRNPKWTRKRLI